MKNKYKKIIIATIAAFLVAIGLSPAKVFATGNVTVSPANLSLNVGESQTVTITAYNTIADVAITSSNTGVATVSIGQWETGMVSEGQNVSQTVTITAVGAGNATINFYLTDAVTFDEEDLSGQTRTVSVSVASGDSDNSVTDTLNVNVYESCTVRNSYKAESNNSNETTTISNTYNATITPGTIGSFTRSGTENKFTIICNYPNGYKIMAKGGDLLLNGSDTNNKIPAANNISGTTTSTSFWAGQISTEGNLKSGATGTSASTGYIKLGSTQTTVAHNDGQSASGSSDSFSTAYRIGAKKTQKAGNYSGQVTYTLVKAQN